MCIFFISDFLSTDYVYFFPYLIGLVDYVYFFSYMIFYPRIMRIFFLSDRTLWIMCIVFPI